MIDLTTQELQVIAQGLDALIRNEGAALNQHGINGLSQSLGNVHVRFSIAVDAYNKVVAALTPPPAPDEDNGAVMDAADGVGG